MIALAVLLAGCASASVEVDRQEATEAHRRLAQLRAEHTQLLQDLSSAPSDHVETCHVTAGDCLLQVAESRGHLVSEFGLNSCQESPSVEAKSGCVTRQLESGKHTAELGRYYSLANWCFHQLTACTRTKAEEARLAALDARFTERKREVERLPEAQAAHGSVLLGRAQVEYVRATLPPNVDVCQPDAAAQACRARVESDRQTFDATLRRDDYDAKAAGSAYVALERAEATCGKPELDCLSAALAEHGVYPESRKWVDKNLSLLGERQELLVQVDGDAGQRCLSASQKQHQASIVSAYVVYVREPVLYFRIQLDKAFMDLHQAEVSCLSASRKALPTRAVTATR